MSSRYGARGTNPNAGSGIFGPPQAASRSAGKKVSSNKNVSTNSIFASHTEPVPVSSGKRLAGNRNSSNVSFRDSQSAFAQDYQGKKNQPHLKESVGRSKPASATGKTVRNIAQKSSLQGGGVAIGGGYIKPEQKSNLSGAAANVNANAAVASTASGKGGHVAPQASAASPLARRKAAHAAKKQHSQFSLGGGAPSTSISGVPKRTNNQRNATTLDKDPGVGRKGGKKIGGARSNQSSIGVGFVGSSDDPAPAKRSPKGNLSSVSNPLGGGDADITKRPSKSIKQRGTSTSPFGTDINAIDPATTLPKKNLKSQQSTDTLGTKSGPLEHKPRRSPSTGKLFGDPSMSPFGTTITSAKLQQEEQAKRAARQKNQTASNWP